LDLELELEVNELVIVDDVDVDYIVVEWVISTIED
jgi:hypothetical protein